MTRRVIVFAIVVAVGLIFRFAPSSNWAWWADIAWIGWMAVSAAALAKGSSK